MKFSLQLFENVALPGINRSYLTSVARATCEAAWAHAASRPTAVALEVISLSDRAIQTLNRDYRHKDRPTDILSFGQGDTATRKAPRGTLELGQIFLSPAYIRRSAKEDGVSWKHEFTYVFSHGILHLLGFDHSKKMFALQDAVTEKFFPSRNHGSL